MKYEKSCGAVVYKEENGKYLFLIEHMALGHTSIPKGHVEPGETEEETALREIREETNLEVDLDTGFRHTISYSPFEGIRKDVVFFVARAKEGDLINQESEVSALEWLHFREAVAAMTYDTDKETLTLAMKHLRNTDIVDKAAMFAARKHSGAFRKGSNVPYIVHPMEAAAIVAGMTDDQEIIAAALLHDTLEDTDTTREELLAEFGERVIALVASESENKREGQKASDTWQIRKEEALQELSQASPESILIAMGDKLSNMRAMARDYAALGGKLWDRFNQKDSKMHGWYYRSLAEIFASKDILKNTAELREYQNLVEKVFGK